ncbi:MAG: cation:dicarboxylate symporter family transporter [Candidatus Paceibacterales bacterium]
MNDVLRKILYSLRYRTIQILATLVIYFLLCGFLQPVVHQGLYTISLLIKDLLMLVIPIVVAFFIAHTIYSLEKRAPLFVFIVILFEGLSNFGSVWYAFACGNFVAGYLPSSFEAANVSHDFHALWRLPFTKSAWWSADKGVLFGLLLGCVGAFLKNSFLKSVIKKGKEIVEWVLTKVFARLIPLYIVGFAAQIYQTQLLTQVFTSYILLVGWLILFLIIYLIFLFMLGAGGSLKGTVQSIKNLLPAGGIALTSGCSLSTMPWTIEGAGKNLKNPNLAKAIVPTTTSVHQIGDCIANTFLCFLIYRHFYGVNPDWIMWINFSMVFVLARFATVGVIGGAIFVMLPIYETYLNFNTEMIAIILALNVILDPLVTSSNVMANGAICRILERVWDWLEAFLNNVIKGARKINVDEK